MAKETDGFTGAWLRELVMLAFSLSLRDENTFDNETLDKALDKIKVLRKKTNKRRTEDEQNEALFG